MRVCCRKCLRTGSRYIDNMKNDEYFADRIINDLSFIAAHTEGITDAELKSDEVLLDSMMFRLIQISENAKKLSGQYRADHSNIPWSDIYGLRNRIVHDYGSIDIGVIYDTLTQDIPDLLTLMQHR